MARQSAKLPAPVLSLCRRLATSPRFDAVMLGVILANAVVLGAETYDGVAREHGDLLHRLNQVFLGVFVVELAIRAAAVGLRPGAFFRNGWNVFDFVVVVGSFLPGLRENATLLRLLRLARVVRAVRFLPDLRVLIAAVARSIPGVSSLAAMTLLLVYLYAMVGWVIFDDHDPENFGNVGQAMVTMFVLLTLENLPTYIETGQALSDWTIAFYVSYVLVASFLVFNLFIGIVLNSMEEARDAELEGDRTEGVEARVRELKAAMEALESELRRSRRD